MPNVRIVLVELRGIERDIVLEALHDRKRMRVVAEVSNRSRLRKVVKSARADLLIWHLDAMEVSEASPELLIEHPKLRVLVLDRDGIGFVWSLRLHKDRLGELSPSSLLTAIEHLFGEPGRVSERLAELT